MGKQISDLVNTDPSLWWWMRMRTGPGDITTIKQEELSGARQAGMTSSLNFNMAHPAARFICYLFWGILAALLLWMVVLFLRLDFTPFGLTIAGNQVSITAGSYDMEFPLEEVEEVSLVDGLPTQDTPKITGPIPGSTCWASFDSRGTGSAVCTTI